MFAIFMTVLVVLALLVAILNFRKGTPAVANGIANPNASGPSAVVDVTEANFDAEVKASTLPVFVEFYTETCPSCVAQRPVLEQVANEYAGKVKFTKINVEKFPRLYRRMKFRYVPTMVIVKANPAVQLTHVGYADRDELVAFIENGIKATGTVGLTILDD